MSGYPYPTTPEHHSMDSKPRAGVGGGGLMRRQPSHPSLLMFREAKKEITKIYSDIDHYVCDCLSFVQSQAKSEEIFANLVTDMPHRIEDFQGKVKGIQEVIDRNQMKCAFFGRTSNGKSTVINAMLGSKVLPAGIGHTTSCFLQVEGTDDDIGYMLNTEKAGQDKKSSEATKPQPVESVTQMAHSLSSVRLSPDSLIHVFWPSGKCRLLREDVVFLDSPGIDIDPDMDNWIDRHCLDADVFILVANSESTIMQAEKKFFYKVSEKLSKPNIFILNNRWDASASECEYIDEVRAQHTERCLTFLVDELKVCSKSEASERVFFTSAKEALVHRTRTQVGTPPASPSPTAFAEGWQGRLFEFTNFEKNFEKTLSESATKTKFASHSEQGREISSKLRDMMEQVYESSVEEKNAAVTFRQMSQNRLEDLKSNLLHTTHEMEKQVRTSLDRVERRVSSALGEEIRRLSDLVGDFDALFACDSVRLAAYKRELNAHIEREMGRKLVEACSSDMLKEVIKTERLMLDSYSSLINEESKRNSLPRHLGSSTFEPEFHVDCKNICANFQEDISFRFSLGFSNLMRRFTKGSKNRYALQGYRDSVPRPMTLHAGGASREPMSSQHMGRGDVLTTPQTPSNESFPSSHMSSRSNGQLLPLVLQTFPSIASKNTIGAVVAVGLVVKVTGWRVLGICGAVFGGLYLYERVSWTTKAKERAFKRQYVDYATQKLRLIVDLTSTNAAHQAKQELITSQKKLHKEVEFCANELKEEVVKLDSDIARLDYIIVESKKLKNTAGFLDNALAKFHQSFIVGMWQPT